MPHDSERPIALAITGNVTPEQEEALILHAASLGLSVYCPIEFPRIAEPSEAEEAEPRIFVTRDDMDAFAASAGFSAFLSGRAWNQLLLHHKETSGLRFDGPVIPVAGRTYLKRPRDLDFQSLAELVGRIGDDIRDGRETTRAIRDNLGFNSGVGIYDFLRQFVQYKLAEQNPAAEE
jgi:hypothetical protein